MAFAEFFKSLSCCCAPRVKEGKDKPRSPSPEPEQPSISIAAASTPSSSTPVADQSSSSAADEPSQPEGITNTLRVPESHAETDEEKAREWSNEVKRTFAEADVKAPKQLTEREWEVQQEELRKQKQEEERQKATEEGKTKPDPEAEEKRKKDSRVHF